MERVKRNVARTQFTKTVNSIVSVLDHERNLEEICASISKLELVTANLKEADRNMEHLLNENENLEEELLKIAEYEETGVTLLARLQFRKNRLEKETTSLNEINRTSVDNAVSSTVPSQNGPLVKLQRLELAKFDGNPKCWLHFWEQFQCSVDNNAQLTNGDKFMYLKMCVQGKAADSIEGFPPSGAFYEEALNVLKEQYGNSEKLVNQYFDTLMNLDQVRSRSDIDTLKRNYNVVTSTIRSLKILNVRADRYNVILKSNLLKSLPTELRLGFFRQEKHKETALEVSNLNVDENTASTAKEESDLQVDALLKFIKNELGALEEAIIPTKCQFEKKREEVGHKMHKRNGTATSLLTTDTKKQGCLFCGEPHKTAICDSNIPLVTKKEMLKAAYRCYRCTEEKHISKRCFNKFIVCSKCKGRHATSMCDPEWLKRIKVITPPAVTTATNSDPSTSTSVYSLMTNMHKNVLLQTACVFAGIDTNNMTLIRLVIDGGSQLTFIKESLSRKLQLPVVGQHRITIGAFGNNHPAPARICNCVRIQLKGQYGNERINIAAAEVPDICMDLLKIPNEVMLKEFPKLQFADIIPEDSVLEDGISILIEADYYWNVVTGENKRLSDCLMAINTKFGFTLHGPVPVDITCVTANVRAVLHASVIEEEQVTQQLWDLEAIGISADNDERNNYVNNFLESSVTKCGKRYKVKLPWKNENVIEDNNYVGAYVRAEKLKFRLERSVKLTEYNNAINALINDNYAEVVDNNNIGVNGRVYYMPHRPVYRDDKETTKLRVVYDASSHGPGLKSLNDVLDKGPNLNPELLSVLLRFRLGTIGITADIEKAFLQILLEDEDKDAHRFLWYDSENKIQTYRMTRVTFGVTCSPFLLSVAVKEHLVHNQEKDSKTVELLKRGFYVDDLVVSVNNLEQAKYLKNFSTDLFYDASMNLRKWVISGISASDKLSEKQPKVLGLSWCNLEDRLSVDLTNVIDYVNSVRNATKRNLLQTIARVYDPLGLIGPFSIKFKILFQRVWKLKLGWDDLLPSELASEWQNWVCQLTHLNKFSVPRCVFKSEQTRECQLHIFSDASLLAYGIAAYIRYEDMYCHVDAELICAKNRVAPLKENSDKAMTLPRLELTAALLAARLKNYLRKNLYITITKTVCWCDSQIALYWIRGEADKWKPYVANRVKEIQTLSKDNCEWRYCPGRDNPADKLTRGITSQDLLNSLEWLQGPKWLKESEKTWPAETVPNSVLIARLLNNCLINEVNENVINSRCFVESERFSSLDRLLRVSAYVLRFLNNVRNKDNKFIGSISVNEIENAEIMLIKDAQYSAYYDEIDSLSKRTVLKRDSKIITLCPFLDERGLMRIGGRLQNLQMQFEVKHPILLPKKAYLSKLIILKTHETLHHSGVNATLCEVRKRFWIVRARQVIKTYLGKCFVCKQLKVKAASMPFAPLPKERIMQTKPFEVTGLDFAGPLYFKENNKQHKAYIFLFTCAVTRALHLEMVLSMDVSASVLALKRFFARRGIPKIIYSDNFKTFKRLSVEFRALNDLLNSVELAEFCCSYRLQWKFIVERASWWGGFYERLVKIVKDCLKATIGRQTLNRDELATVLTEVEATVNARPLTYVGSDPFEAPPLTPAHFLVGPAAMTIPTISKRSSGDFLRQQWRQRQRAMVYFWKRWSTEYLQLLRHAHHNVNVRECSIKVGDVVMIHGVDSRRLLWKMGVVTNVIPGRDGKIRACYVKCANGQILRRPVQLLYPLEIND